MNTCTEDIVNELLDKRDISDDKLKKLLETEQENETLRNAADNVRRKIYGNEVYLRGLIEFTNICRNNCYYCGIRRDNRSVNRYRLSEEEILGCCREGYSLGYRTFVLQGGEDMYYSDKSICGIVYSIKSAFPDCAVTLSIGERPKESYKAYFDAGADRYLLRHETANEEHYQILHPAEMKLSERKSCLYNLKKLGFQTGAGFMVGSPGQTIETLADDLVFLEELQPQMVGIGPFIPHHDTAFAKEPAGSVEMTLFFLAVIRIMLPKVLLPATTALGTMDELGREKGMDCGANVIMPNLSPLRFREKYSLYDNKISTGDEAAEAVEEMRQRMKRAGYELVQERGDYLTE